MGGRCVFGFPGLITDFGVLSFGMAISLPREASLATTFSKLLSNGLQIRALPECRVLTYAAPADTKAKTTGPKSSLSWFVSGQSGVKSEIRNRNSGLFLTKTRAE